MKRCDLSPATHKHIFKFERTHPHTSDTQDVWSPKPSSQGPSLKAVTMATDRHTQHSSNPARVDMSNADTHRLKTLTHTHTLTF